MSRVCTKCGNLLGDDAMFCNRCGHQVTKMQGSNRIQQNTVWKSNSFQAASYNTGMGNQSAKAHYQDVKYIIQHKIKDIGKKKNLKVGVPVIVILFAVVFFTLINRAPSTITLKKQFPQDLLSYRYEGETCNSEIKSFKVERRQTTKNYDTAYCKVVLDDENMTRILYVQLNSQKYSQGGWNVDYWSLFQNDEITGKKEPIEESQKENRLLKYLEHSDEAYAKNIQETKEDDGSYRYVVDFETDSEVGTLNVIYRLVNQSERSCSSLQDVSFPMEYGWDANLGRYDINPK